MANAKRDENRIPTLIGVSSVDGVTPTLVYVDPTTNRLLVDMNGGGGDVVGPGIAVDSNFVAFNTTTGKLIKDSGFNSSSFLTSLSGAVLTSQATPQTIGDTTNRLAKLWATDITVSNTITGSISGNAGTVTNGVYTTSKVTVLAATDAGDKDKYLHSNASTGVLEWSTIGGGGDVSKVGTPVDNQVGVWTGDGTIEGTTGFTYNGANLLLTGDIGATGTRITKGWFTDLTVTNAIAGAVTGNAGTVTNATLTTALTVNTGTVTLTGNVAGSVLTIGAGAVSVSGSNTGDQDLTGYVTKALFNAHTIIYATTDDTPVALEVTEQTLVGRLTSGNISAVAIGIADNNVLQVDDASAADNDYAKFTANGIEGVAYATVLSDIGAAPTASPTLTGTITISDNTRIDLTLPTADTYVTGNTTDSFASGYSSAVGDLVFMGSASKWLEVDADAVATCKGMIGIALEAKSDTEAMKVALPGSFVRLDAWNWTVGATLYAGETLGAIQETIPTGADAVIKVIGFAVNADTIYFNPSPDQQTTVA